jgi:autotransporter passenger strand-loop-strand repeat protein
MTIYTVPPNVSDVTVIDDSAMNIDRGGTATSVTVEDGSVVNINAGGTASYTQMSSGAADVVHSGGETGGTSRTILNGLGIEKVHGTASVTVSSGTENLYSNAQYVYSGGTATGTTVNSGGFEEDFGRRLRGGLRQHDR